MADVSDAMSAAMTVGAAPSSSNSELVAGMSLTVSMAVWSFRRRLDHIENLSAWGPCETVIVAVCDPGFIIVDSVWYQNSPRMMLILQRQLHRSGIPVYDRVPTDSDTICLH